VAAGHWFLLDRSPYSGSRSGIQPTDRSFASWASFPCPIPSRCSFT